MNKTDLIIGEYDAFHYLAPYDTILSDITLYKVTNITTLTSMVSQSLDPFKNLYEVYGMSDTDFEEDLVADIAIVELTLDNNTYNVPIDRIVDRVPGVVYSERGIGISVGFIPSNESLAILNADIIELVKSRLGVVPVVTDTILTAEVKIDQPRHDARVVERNTLKQAGNYADKYFKARADLEQALVKISALETAELNTRL